MNTPHIHAELIKAWADGAKIQYADGPNPNNPCWHDLDKPTWNPNALYRIKPERVYPKSTLTFEEMYDLMWPVEGGQVRTVRHHNNYYARVFQSIADAAIKKYIQDQEAPS